MPAHMTKQQRADIVLQELIRLYPISTPSLTYTNNWELLVAVMLSAQTSDKQVNVVTRALFAKYTTLSAYVTASPETFTHDIRQIGLYKTKAKHILATANIIYTTYNGEIPNTMQELLALPGVGKKTANVVLGHAYGIAEGIAVDTHVARLTKKFQLTNSENPTYIEKELMNLIPQSEWILFTNRMISYGRDYSPAHKVNDITDPISQALLT